MKEFNKASLSAKEQLNLLIDRGLIVKDYESALCVLKQNGYYHLSSYMRLFQEGSGHNFIENTEFADIYNLAVFDRKLRFIVFNTLQQIEISYRAAISSVLCKKGSSHWFYDENNFREKEEHKDILELIQKQIHKSNKPKEFSETFIALNCNWLQVLNVTRNICAHHSRLFNRIFRIAPTKHKKIKELNLSNTKNIYYILMIINYYLLIIRSNSSFEEILKQLLGCYPQFYKPIMGFPENWAKFTYERTGKIVQNIK